MEYCIVNGELYHHGIKGQKWGRRRYQNADGSLTPAGKKRYRRQSDDDVSNMSDKELRDKVNRMNLERRYVNLSKSDPARRGRGFDAASKAASAGANATNVYKKTGELNKVDTPFANVTNQGFNAASRTLSTAKKVSNLADDKYTEKKASRKAKELSDDELRDIVNRMDLERQYSSLKQDDIDRGKLRVVEVLDVVSDVAAISASIVGIAVGLKKLGL
jgi:hypothetical protein